MMQNSFLKALAFLFLSSPVLGVASGIVGQWSFDGKASTLADQSKIESKKGPPALVLNKNGQGMKRLTSPFGAGISFDGVDDGLLIPYQASFNPTKYLTLSLIFKTDDTAKKQILISTLQEQGGYALFLDGSNLVFKLMLKDTSGAMVKYPLERISPNHYYHVVARYNGQEMRLFVNGAQVGAVVEHTGEINYVAKSDVCIGASPVKSGCDNSKKQNFVGVMDEVTIMNKTLKVTAVKALFQDYSVKGKLSVAEEMDETWAPHWDRLVGYWKLNGLLGNLAGGLSIPSTQGPAAETSNADKKGLARVGQGLQQALKFDGVNDYLQIPYQESLAPTKEVSVSLLFKTADVGRKQMIVSKFQKGGYGIYLNGKALVFRVFVNGKYHDVTYPATELLNNEWHHVVGTYDGKSIKIYVNGAPSEELTTGSAPIEYASKNSLCIGRDAGSKDCAGSKESLFKGLIDEVAVWNYALNDEDVRKIMERYSELISYDCDPAKKMRVFRVMTYNIKKGVGPTASLQTGGSKAEYIADIGAYLKKTAPRIVLLQEIGFKSKTRGPWKNGLPVDQVEALADLADYPYFLTVAFDGKIINGRVASGALHSANRDTQGIGILSKYPIVETWASALPLPKEKPTSVTEDDWDKPYAVARASVKFNGHIVDVYATHLTSKGPILRPRQAAFITKTMADRSEQYPERPQILGGDLNLHPEKNVEDAEAFEVFRKSLTLPLNKDNYQTTNYSGKADIDHIGFRSGQQTPLMLRRYRVYRDIDLSDHRPVQASFCLPK